MLIINYIQNLCTISNYIRKSIMIWFRNFYIHLNSDYAGKIVGNHIPTQNSTFANGLYSYINDRVLVTSDHNIGFTSVQYTLFSVIIFLTTKFTLCLCYNDKLIFRNFYGRSGVCLALHITPDKPNGWEYSVFIFLCIR